jgi:MFS transporter, DHA1 family, multidrug resistance protein
MTLAPLSEAPGIGRTPVYVWTLLAFMLLQIPTALSVDLGMLLVFRFITGVLGSPPLATGGASVAEIFRPKQRGLAIGCWGVAAIFGPALGPLIGGFVAQAKGWRWTIWTLMWISAVALVLLFFFLPEVSAKNILYRRAQRLRKLTGNNNLRTEAEIAYQHVTVQKVMYMTIIRPWILTFTEPLVFMLHTWVALIFGILFIWFTSYPLVFEGIYGFNQGESGLAFIGLLVGAMACIPPYIAYDQYVQKNLFTENGHIKKVEQRLVPAMATAATLPICLCESTPAPLTWKTPANIRVVWFGWSSQKDIHWYLPSVPSPSIRHPHH